MAALGGLDYDAFDDGSSRRVGELQENKLRKFVHGHRESLNTIEDALDLFARGSACQRVGTAVAVDRVSDFGNLRQRPMRRLIRT